MEESKTIGTLFREERSKKKISLEEVTKATKLSKSIILAIENDNFEDLPGGFFNRGILKTYANFLELDEDKILNRYKKEFEKKEEGRKRILEVKEGFTPLFFSKKTLIIIFIIIAFGFFVWLLIPEGFSNNKLEEIKKIKGEKVSSSFQVKEKNNKIKEGIKKEEKAKVILENKGEKKTQKKNVFDKNSINIKLIFNGECWVEVKRGDSIVISKLFYGGQSFQTNGKSFTIKLGKPSAVELYINGKKYVFKYKKGVPKNLEFDVKSLSDFLK